MNVHRARSNEQLRNEQAEGLREWAKSQRLPVLLAGDCNFDYSFATSRGNRSYQLFFAGSVFKAAEPKEWIDTNWADSNHDGVDDYPNSALDFAAVADKSGAATASSQVIVREGDFPDTAATSDHRPLLIRYALP